MDRAPIARLAVRAAVTLTLATVLVAVGVGTAGAAAPGIGGWYWPLGHDHTSAGGSWLQYRTWYADSPAWHLAFDDVGTWRDPVYAAADGVVLEARGDVGGYGPGATKGGAVVVGYRTADGIDFKALYGHVEGIRVVRGQNVRAGDVLAYLNAYAPAHVHFGIHLGTGYPAPSAEQTATSYVGIWMGHSHESTLAATGARVPITYGWTNPVAFLGSHTPSSPPAPVLTRPSAPRSVRARRSFTVTGYVAPRHRPGTRPVTIEAYRLENGAWVLRARATGLAATVGSRTRYTARLALRRKGTYRLIASIPGDAAHLAGNSAGRTIKAR